MDTALPRMGWTPQSERALPTATTVAQAVMGFVALGATVALGSPDVATAAGHAPTALLVDAGSLLLTGPALMVGHQFLGLDAPVADLASDLSWAFVRSGGVALGLSPFVLFFAATSGLAPGLLAFALPVIGGLGLAHAAVGMCSSERRSGSEATQLKRMLKMRGLLAGWAVLTVLVGLRLAVRMVLA